MVKGKLKINSPTGLHMRPVGILSQQAAQYESRVEFLHKSGRVNVKSVLSILAAGICFGDEVELVCDGPDEREAFERLSGMIANEL